MIFYLQANHHFHDQVMTWLMIEFRIHLKKQIMLSGIIHIIYLRESLDDQLLLKKPIKQSGR